MRSFEKLPSQFNNDSVKKYYDILCKKKASLVIKRIFDLTVALIALVFLLIPIAVIALIIKLGSPGPVFFLQKRVTKYGRVFNIIKFRTMVVNA